MSLHRFNRSGFKLSLRKSGGSKSKPLRDEEQEGKEDTDTLLREIPDEALEKYKVSFKAVDGDGSGNISKKELEVLFRNLEMPVTDFQLDYLIKETDKDGSGEIDSDEFCIMMWQLSVGTLTLPTDKNSIQTPFQEKLQVVWNFLDDPGSGPGAQTFSLVVMSLIVFSCTTFVIETLPPFHNRDDTQPFWGWTESIVTICFTVEFLLRLLVCPKKLVFIMSPLNIIDIVAILPYYVEEFAVQMQLNTAQFRILRLIRVFRVFKISRYLTWVHVFIDSFRGSLQALGMVLFLLVLAIVFFSSLIFYAERGEYNDELGYYIRSDGRASPFVSIPASMWFIFISMATIGYGDLFPIEPAGKIVSILSIFCGIMLLAIPIALISANFTEEYGKIVKIKKADDIQKQKTREAKNKLERIQQERLETEVDESGGINTTSKRSVTDTIHLESILEHISVKGKDITLKFKKSESISRHNLIKAVMDTLTEYSTNYPEDAKYFDMDNALTDVDAVDADDAAVASTSE